MPFSDDFVLARDLDRNRNKKEQVRNGLRLGLGAGAFLIAGMLLRSGLTRVVSSASPHHLVWSDWIAWLEICVAIMLLFLTAQVWLLLVGGYALFGLGKAIVSIITGKALYAPYMPIPRTTASIAAVFALLTLLLLFRFVDARPNLFDRVALTFYVFAVSWSIHRTASSVIDPWLLAALIGLAISWSVYRWQKAQKPERENASGA